MRMPLYTFLFLVMLIVASPVQASNMVFHFSLDLDIGDNWISLPCHFALTTADDLFQDIGGAAYVASVSRWNSFTGRYATWDGSSGVNFSLTCGEGYRVTMLDNVSYEVCGSHDPTSSINIYLGTNWIALPYHTTIENASQLINELNDDLGCSLSSCITSVSRWNKASSSYDVCSGTGGLCNNFPITPGEAYQVIATSSGTFTPSFY